MLFALLATGCAAHSGTSPQHDATSSCSLKVLDRLYFGMDSPDGPVGDVAWQGFLREVVTPLFPDGLTILDAHGQWLGKDKRIVHEASHIVEILHDDSEKANRSVVAIAGEYRKRFHQEAVLVMTSSVRACL